MECVIPMDHTWAYGGESWSGAQKDLDAAPRWRQSQTRVAGRKRDITHAITMGVAAEKSLRALQSTHRRKHQLQTLARTNMRS